MSTIKVLDVTLRDGGCVNDFNFGQDYMNLILHALERSGVDYIELGYIDEKLGTEKGRTQYCNEKVIPQYFLKEKVPGVTYVAMIDYGTVDVDQIGERSESGIDGIRIAFHKKNWKEVLALGRKIVDKGYEFYIQPMITMRYTDQELLQLIDAVNNELPDASGFYIVDSFGEMRGNDVIRLMHLVDNNLIPSMTLGLHSHNNLQLSYSNAMSLLSFPTTRNLMLDASIMGMGKGAGNLNTELLLEHLNLYHGKQYKTAPLLEVIDKVISVLHSETYWGYSVEYYLSSINHCTPSYAGHFYNKHMLTIDQVAELLGMIAEEKKISFDKEYAEELYTAYNARSVYDDMNTIRALKKMLAGKKALLIAPGKSISKGRGRIESCLREDNVVSFGLNNFEFDTDFVIITRTELLTEAQQHHKRTIIPSNLSGKNLTDAYVVNYERWILKDEETHDSSGAISLQLMVALTVSEILLAGFDGFSADINENYAEPLMRKPINPEQAEKRNQFHRNLIAKISEKGKVTFLTASKYEEVSDDRNS